MDQFIKSNDVHSVIQIVTIFSSIIEQRDPKRMYETKRNIDTSKQYSKIFQHTRGISYPVELINQYIQQVNILEVTINHFSVAYTLLNVCKDINIGVIKVHAKPNSEIVIGLHAKDARARRYLAILYSARIAHNISTNPNRFMIKIDHTLQSAITDLVSIDPEFCPLVTEPEMRPYEKCNTNDSNLVCSGCTYVRYCTKSCQHNDWPMHKKQCKKWRKESLR